MANKQGLLRRDEISAMMMDNEEGPTPAGGSVFRLYGHRWHIELPCDDAREWVQSLPKTTTAAQAWRLCPRGDWLLWLYCTALTRLETEGFSKLGVSVAQERKIRRALRRAVVEMFEVSMWSFGIAYKDGQARIKKQLRRLKRHPLKRSPVPSEVMDCHWIYYDLSARTEDFLWRTATDIVGHLRVCVMPSSTKRAERTMKKIATIARRLDPNLIIRLLFFRRAA